MVLSIVTATRRQGPGSERPLRAECLISEPNQGRKEIEYQMKHSFLNLFLLLLSTPLFAVANELDYTEPDEVLHGAILYSPDETTLSQRIEDLTALADAFPKYPRLGYVHYQIGVNHKLLEQYSLAIRAFDRAYELAPRLEKTTPIKAYLHACQVARNRAVIPRVCIGTIAFLLLISLVLFIRNRRNLAPRAIRISVGLLLLWIVLAVVVDQWDSSSLVTPPDTFATPVLINTKSTQLGGELTRNLLYYSGAAILSSLFLALSFLHIRRRPVRLLLSALGPALLCSAYLGIFFMNNCYDQTIFVYGNSASIPIFSSHILSPVKDITDVSEIPKE
ncbi:hypothetical protein BVY04_02325, partial [bacterium M21]